MATVCLKSKFGYCKFGSRCENIHYEEVCENNVQLCIGKLCEKRHPVFCKFFNSLVDVSLLSFVHTDTLTRKKIK